MNKIVVITGCSSGIGAALCSLFEAGGDTVIGISRSNKTFLEHFIACDLSCPEDITTALEAIKSAWGRVDILVNNAGLGISGAQELMPLSQARGVFEVDYFAALSLAQKLLPLIPRGGKIVNISSACALFALPFRAVYCSAKAAMNMFSFGLRMELDGSGIDVVCVCPGDIKSNFTANRIKNFDTNERYGKRVELSAKKVDDRESKRMSLDKCGKKIYKIASARRGALYIIGAKYKFLNFCQRLLPTSLFLKLTTRLFNVKEK